MASFFFVLSGRIFGPLFVFGMILLLPFDICVICVYDYSGWANVIEYHASCEGTYIHIYKSRSSF